MSGNQEQYEALLAKYLRNECTDDERAQLDRWYASLDETVSMPVESELAAIGQKNWSVIASQIGQQQPPVQKLPMAFRWSRIAAAVAGLTILAGIGWYAEQRTGFLATVVATQQTASNGWVVKANTTNRPLLVSLSDGSIVTLRPNSELRYPSRFSKTNRVVELTGQAFFEVQKDPAHPFRVHTNRLDVNVLGTSFTVRAFAGQPTAEVSVRTGRVEVVRSRDKANLVLMPNERVTVSDDARLLVKSLVDRPVVVNPKAVVNAFNFANAPVADVFGTLERAYTVSIRFDAKTLANCTLTAQLTDQPLFTKLDMICASIGATYAVQGTEIVVTGTGCDE